MCNFQLFSVIAYGAERLLLLLLLLFLCMHVFPVILTPFVLKFDEEIVKCVCVCVLLLL